MFKEKLFEVFISKEKKSLISGPFGSNISAKYFVNSGVPVIRGNNLSLGFEKFKDEGFVYVTQEKADELNTYAILDDIVFTAVGTLGQVGIIPESSKFKKYIISNKQLRVRLDTTKLNPLFAFYWFTSPWMIDSIKARNVGSTVPLINLSIVRNLPVRAPENIEYQKNIAKVLSDLDAKIELNNKINAELEAMAKLIYDYWFVQFEFPNEDGKPYKSSGGKMVWNAELKREIPEGWEVKELGDVIEKTGTGLNPRDNFKLGEGTNFYVTIKSIEQGKVILDSKCDKINDEALEIINKRSDLREGDILFTSIQPVGITYLLRETPNNWNINESVFTIRPNYKKITSEFLYMFLSGDFIKAYTNNVSAGSIHKGIRHTTLKECLFILPNRQIIDEYSKFTKLTLRKIHNIDLSNQKLAELRDWLLPMLMNGQVKVENVSETKGYEYNLESEGMMAAEEREKY